MSEEAREKKDGDVAGEEDDDGGNHIEVAGTTISVVTVQPGDATNFPQSEQTVRIHYVATLEVRRLVEVSSTASS